MKHTAHFDDVTAIADSGKALLCSCPEWDKPQWIPHSQIDDDSEVYRDADEGTLIVSEWLAKEKGLI